MIVMKTALLIIDIQNDYFAGGSMELVGPVEAATQARALLDLFRARELPTIHIQHISNRPGATFFLPDTQGVMIHESIAPVGNETIITKHFPNSFRETALLEHLNKLGVERIVITGMMTHMCVDATTRAAADLGYAVLLAADACATRNLSYGGISVPAAHVHAAFLAALQSYGQVLSAGEIMGQLKA
jgi:nicotinamidase-related amidase